ncbi:hypothetical protein Mapa_006799 [Marchantia paleacea]|nr:hypothetical protein Mapa_006799 [Marchantia paleacea]
MAWSWTSIFMIGLCFSVTVLNTMTVSSANSPTHRVGGIVGFDHRSLVIDGHRRFLISGSIHYPRSTPEMWPGILRLAKEGGLDVIDTYVFWNGHEPRRGEYNFAGRYDVVRFLKAVQAEGLHVNLRVGPYVCAEWNFGGFPEWLIDIPGIELRTDNEPFKKEMEIWTTHLVRYLKDHKLFYSQGGPIIMSQIENEYGHVSPSYGEAGKRYSSWAAYMAENLRTSVPWIMCLQKDAPAHIINTCNNFYCDEFTPNSPNKPKIWTENYPGWLHYWGQTLQSRPVQDLAFAVARFFQSGGSYMNYYMYHGGTNFDRTAARMVTTSYDYTAPIDEYGQARQPMWEHLKNLHSAIKMSAPALAAVSGEPLVWSPQKNVQIHVYQTKHSQVQDFQNSQAPTGICAGFLSNVGLTDALVSFKGRKYHLPAWSVSILPDCKSVAFNTMHVPDVTSVKEIVTVKPAAHQNWKFFADVVGPWDSHTVFTSKSPYEQFRLTKDRTDYLWYRTSFIAPQNELPQWLVVKKAEPDMMHVFLNGKHLGHPISNSSGFFQPLTLQQGHNTIDILSVTSGRPSSGSYLEQQPGGIKGSVTLHGPKFKVTELTDTEWVHQVGLKGEDLHLETVQNSRSRAWSTHTSFPPKYHPLMWYKTVQDAPSGEAPVVLDLGSMGKGAAWVNGHHIGRYWSQIRNPSEGCDKICSARGKWHPNKCVVNCGHPSQRFYHVPRSWLKQRGNLIVLFEELGGDPHGVSFSTQIHHTLHAHHSSKSHH